MTALLIAAQQAAARGWRIIPLHHVGGKLKCCSCSKGLNCGKSAGKHPKFSEWERQPPLSAADIYATWGDCPPGQVPNLGIATGAPSGFWVLDCDLKGMEAARKLAEEHGPFPETRIVRTGSGGYHYYFAMPPDFEVTNRQGRIPKGIDVRGTGGQVVAPPSESGIGSYVTLHDVSILPRAPKWLEDLVRPPERTDDEAEPEEIHRKTLALPATEMDRLARYTETVVKRELNRLRECTAKKQDVWDDGYDGPPWNTTTYEVSCVLIQLANSPWSPYTVQQARIDVLDTAPRDPGFGQDEILKCFTSALNSVGDKIRDIPLLNQPLYPGDPISGEVRLAPAMTPMGLVAPPKQLAPLKDPSPVISDGRELLDVSNDAIAADWLRDNIGRGKLAGMFARGHEIVHVPQINEQGYQELTDTQGNFDGPAQVRTLTPHGIAAQVHFRYLTYKTERSTKGDTVRTRKIFPITAATIALAASREMTHLRPLRGVVHSVTVRADGSLVNTPGYDEKTGLLYLPTPGLTIPPIPDNPSSNQVEWARAMIMWMLAEFSFITPADRANYIGLMLTPLLRDVASPPYKLAVIEAHQPGSGKTFLARALITTHGGVFRSELPSEEPEIKKSITSILDVTTGPVVVFDNVSGILRSSTLAGLITTPEWTDRRLGTGSQVRATNNRLWVVTGNNMALGGDFARRTIRVRLDPGVPRPDLRANFRIPNFESWVNDNRGKILWALLTLVRNWYSQGRPTSQGRGADSFRQWGDTIQGILAAANFGPDVGYFDDPTINIEAPAVGDDEWKVFLEAIYERFGEGEWTAKELLSHVYEGIPAATHLPAGGARSMHIDLLPGDLIVKRRHGEPIVSLTRSLGWWLRNREGRWAGEYTIKSVKAQGANMSKWHVAKYSSEH